MKKSPTILLQIIIVLIGIAVLAFMLWEPHLEGRNANATVFEIYFNDPFLAYVYIASIAFFTGLYQAFKVLGFVRQNKVFTQESVKALQTIKYSSIMIIGFVMGAVIILLLGESDDRPPVIAMGTLFIFASVIVASGAAMFERIVQKGLGLKSENDLTV